MSIGSVARDTRRTSRLTPSSRIWNASGPRSGDRFAFAIDRADEHHTFASGLGRVGCGERTANAADTAAAATNDRISVKRMGVEKAGSVAAV